MRDRVTVEIFVIGDEIVNGDILDTNTNWLCKEIGNLGGFVSRTVTLRDDENIIAAEVQAAVARGTKVILTSGGLGPTADDLTLAGVARGVGTQTALHQEALRMIESRYDEMAASGKLPKGGLNPAREKMAWLPVGAEPLHNPVGTACGVLVRSEHLSVVSLPGIPPELKGIFGESLRPFLSDTFGGGMSETKTIIVKSGDETVIEPVLNRVVKEHPRVYIKSLAKTCGAAELRITMTAVGDDRAELESAVSAASKDLCAGLDSVGFAYEGA